MERVVVDFNVVFYTLMVGMTIVIGKLIIDMVVDVDMTKVQLQQLDGKEREYVVGIYFPFLPLWYWPGLLDSHGR